MNKPNQDKIRTAVDLFAGGGGLSVGLKKAGFLVCGAVEIEPTAAATYEVNHPNTVVFQSDIRSISGKQLIHTSPTSKIDMVSACPPCQGFSSLTAKYRRKDPRDELIMEFVRLVREIQPLAIMMENVPGLVKKGASIFECAVGELRSMGYVLTHDVLDVADYGVPQRRRRLVVLGGKGNAIAIPKPTHARVPTKGVKPWVTVREAIGNEDRPVTLQKALKIGGPASVGWHVIRNMSDVNLERLRATRPGKSRSELPIHLRPNCHRDTDTGFSNVYGRMAWDKPSPAITGGCTTLSKGRFGHPSLLRTISVSEAASLQSFPRGYKFNTVHIDKACDIVGNALPPKFAKVMAEACFDSIERGQHG